MHLILLPLFTARLVLSLVFFLVKISLVHLAVFKSLIWSAGLFIAIIGLLIKTTINIPTSKTPETINALNPNDIQTRQFFSLENNKTAKKELWEKLVVLEEKQPTHRDVLLNLALLSWYDKKNEEFANYLERASFQDPNNEVVKKLQENL